MKPSLTLIFCMGGCHSLGPKTEMSHFSLTGEAACAATEPACAAGAIVVAAVQVGQRCG